MYNISRLWLQESLSATLAKDGGYQLIRLVSNRLFPTLVLLPTLSRPLAAPENYICECVQIESFGQTLVICPSSDAS